MSENAGNLDRLIRLVVGVVLSLLPFVTAWAIWDSVVLTFGTIVVGLVLAGTSAFKFCPIYRVLGISTCRRQL
ncbi:DUF2892 domain-containing protein [Shimia sp. SDUM112013]|uniref:YgaP family membrane protein n=1 Tax=Shimia sp. SDUM112013 TaxID=3136160 RepID=UPI0032EAFB33